MNDAAIRRLRATLAGAAGLVGALAFRMNLGPDPKPAVWIPVLGPVVAALMVQLPAMGPQLLARGLWWSNVVLGVILATLGGRSESTIGLTLLYGCGAALVLADRRALAAAAERADFRPVAYAGTLQLLMVLALADAPTLALFASIERGRHGGIGHLALAAAAAALLVGFVGLYRLALWGVLVTAATSLALGVAVAARVVVVHREMDQAVMAICAVQLLVVAPMLASIAARRPLPAPSPRLRGALANALVIALAAVATAVSVYRAR
jgi:hypothetical protein